jgi:hypothetical protein
MESVYVATTVVSYLVARPSRDVIVTAHQQTTHDWWDTRLNEFECYVSQVVIDEASLGDSSEVQKRLDAIRTLPLLEVTQSAELLARAIMESGVLPPKAIRDSAHIAIAAVHRIDYLVTWNCRHLANAQIASKIREVCDRLSKRMPVICTPEELMGS